METCKCRHLHLFPMLFLISSLKFSASELNSTSLEHLYITSDDFIFNQSDSTSLLSRELFQNTDEARQASPTGKCPDKKKCVKCRVRTAPNPTNPKCTCCGNPKQCLHQHLCVPMELFCAKGHYLRYSDKEIAHVCFPCPLGQYCKNIRIATDIAATNACRVTLVMKQQYLEQLNARRAEKAGFFKAEITDVECQECPYGYSTNNSGAKECSAEDGIGIDEPTECNPSHCIPCKNLPPNAVLDHALCTCCPQGMCTYREKCTEFNIPCEHGLLKKDDNSKSCQFCPHGTYCDE
uniref:Antistasin-like domain-containing protein n=1 Tax=Strigamia maritima TaxID=126957 RepID=T1IWB9_STRMM